MLDFWKSNSSITKALVALGIDPEAQFRLKDIIPEEISIVNRAANKRRFLVVKKLEGAQHMKTNITKVAIPKSVHAAMLRALTESLERLVSVVNGVKGAELTDDQTDQPIPSELSTEISEISKILTGLLEAYPSPTAKDDLGTSTAATPAILSNLGTEASDKLKVLAAAIAQIAEAESPDALGLIAQRIMDTAKSAGAATQMLKFATALLELVPQDAAQTQATISGASVVPQSPVDPAAPASGGVVQQAQKIDPAVPPQVIAQPAVQPTVDATQAVPVVPPLVEDTQNSETIECDTTVAKAAEAIALSLTEVAKVGAKMSGARLQRLRMAAQTLVELIDELGRTSSEKSAGSAPGTTPVVTPPEVAPPVVAPQVAPPIVAVQPEMVTKAEYDALASKVNKLLDQPVPPASRREGVSTGAGKKSPTSQPTSKRTWIV